MMPPPFRTGSTRRSHGFTLVEIVVVLVIVAILLAMAAALTRGVSAAQKRSLTTTRMAGVDASMVQFAMQQQRLPCPADGTIPTGIAGAGIEKRDITLETCTLANQANGVVPWVTLGLSEQDASDGWDRRLTYRTDPALVKSGAMNMSQCDPAGTGPATGGLCTPGCVSTGLAACTSPTAFLAGKGLPIKNTVGGLQMDPAAGTGAAYAAISSGESGGGAYLGSGIPGVSTTTDGLEEQKNYANLALQPYYLDDATSDVAGPNHFDDMVSRPSVMSVITRAALGPRSH